MKASVFWIVAAAGLALVGCNKAQSPAEVQHDVTEARADAQRDVADAQADARENNADATKDVADAQADHDADDTADQAQQASETAAKGDYKVAVAQAEATHKVASAKCESLSGDAQRDCKDRADRDLYAAKRVAEQRRDGSGRPIRFVKRQAYEAQKDGGFAARSLHGRDSRGRLLEHTDAAVGRAGRR